MGNVIKRQDTPDERKAALLDAMIDRELSRPDWEQDPDALSEWNTMIDELTGGAYRPTRAEKRRLVKAMKEHRRTREGQNHPNAAKKKRIRAAVAVVAVLAVLLLPAGAWAGEIRTALDELFLRMKPQLNALEDGDSLVVHTENADYFIIKGDCNRLKTPEELADYLRVPVLWPSWLPEGVETGTIFLNMGSFASVTLIPHQNGFSFNIDLHGNWNSFPETKTVTVCGEDAEFSYYLNEDGSGGGNFFHGGLLYNVQFSAFSDAERFLDGLTETEGGGQ